MAGKMILETKRLFLREFEEGDIEPYFLMLSDPAVLRYTGDPGGGVKSREEALEMLRSRPIADYQKYGYGRWACVLKATGDVIGFAGLKYLPESQEVDIGYRLLTPYWGQGLATEASMAALDYGRTHLKLERISALVDPENVASVKILEKLGLRTVGQVEYEGKYVTKYIIQMRGST